MGTQSKRKLRIAFILGIAGMLSVGIFLGISIAAVKNTIPETQAEIAPPALPSQIFDRKGRVITEFFSEERRKLVSIHELPKYLIYALITREDQDFFQHKGYSIRGIVRAAWNLATGRFVSGGSTITQQLAGYLYADRREYSLSRKLRELWWSLQLERNWSKYEILETYLNTMNFGHGNYGVEAASQYYFAHSAKDITIAEAAMLVIQLANPSLYSPIRRPNRAKTMQKYVLNQMVERGYADRASVDRSFTEYWENYDFTRSNTSTAFFERENKAAHFSEHIRYILENEILLGSWNVNIDGLSVYTTLDLDLQEHAMQKMREGITKANIAYQKNSKNNQTISEDILPLVQLLGLSFNIPELLSGSSNRSHAARIHYRDSLNSVLDLVLLTSGLSAKDRLHYGIKHSYIEADEYKKKTTVEGALITIENETGYVLAMVGGSTFEARNQFNRALDAYIEPGSAFKPLYYSAAIEHKVITPATMLYDSPVVFWNDDNTPYKPENYRGKWAGKVLVRRALSNSMNVPSLKVLERVGFTKALDTASLLLGIAEDERIVRNLVRKYPVGLGIVSIAPVELARAYATFANEGREVTPIMIRYIEDRNHLIIARPELDILEQQKKKGAKTQLISKQTAYIMTDLLQSTVKTGTLRYAESVVGSFDQPTAGKTGTTQNWADAWTVGFTPYYTTAIWFGFDQGGQNSLGVNQTGAVTAGPVWAKYMKSIHEGLPERNFTRPEGITEHWVTLDTGELVPEDYNKPVYKEIFISGTAPRVVATQTAFEKEREKHLSEQLQETLNTHYSGEIIQNSAYSILKKEDNNYDLDADIDITLSIPDLSKSTTSLLSDEALVPESDRNPLLD